MQPKPFVADNSAQSQSPPGLGGRYCCSPLAFAGLRNDASGMSQKSVQLQQVALAEWHGKRRCTRSSLDDSLRVFAFTSSSSSSAYVEPNYGGITQRLVLSLHLVANAFLDFNYRQRVLSWAQEVRCVYVEISKLWYSEWPSKSCLYIYINLFRLSICLRPFTQSMQLVVT